MKQRQARGFTLVELMVVVVIIAVLASLAFMMGNKALKSAKSAACLSNMRQVHTSVMDITTEGVMTTYNPPGTFPPYAGMVTKPWGQFIWVDLIGLNLGLVEREKGDYVWKVHPKTTILQNPLSEFKVGGEGDDWATLYGNRAVAGGSYAFNAKICEWVGSHTPGKHVSRVSEVIYPAMTILFGESDDELARKKDVTWAFWGTGNVPQGRYKESAHCMFADGHGELIRNSVLKSSDGYFHYAAIKPPQKKMARP